MKKKDKDFEPAYKTEDQLKAEAKARLEMDRKLAAARKPPTKVELAEKKVDNFFYHYKGLTIGAVVAVFMLGFFIYDMLSRENPDITVIMVGEKFISTEMTMSLAEALKPYVPDLNGDKKVTVAVDALMISRTEQDPDSQQPNAMMDSEMEYANVMKLMALLSTNNDPVFLMDKPNYDFLINSGASGEGSEPEPGSLFYVLDGVNGAQGEGLPLSATKLSVESGALGELSFYCRVPGANAKQKAVDYFEWCREIVASLSA